MQKVCYHYKNETQFVVQFKTTARNRARDLVSDLAALAGFRETRLSLFLHQRIGPRAYIAFLRKYCIHSAIAALLMPVMTYKDFLALPGGAAGEVVVGEVVEKYGHSNLDGLDAVMAGCMGDMVAYSQYLLRGLKIERDL